MKYAVFASFFFLATTLFGQITLDNFNEPDVKDGWTESAVDLSIENGALRVDAQEVGGSGKYELFFMEFDVLDMSRFSVITLKIKMPSSNTTAPRLRFDVRDNNGYDGNAAPPIVTPTIGDDFVTYTLDYTNRFRSVWPTNVMLDSDKIIRFSVYVNANFGSPYTGTFYIDDLVLEGAQDKNLITSEQTWLYSTTEEANWTDKTFDDQSWSAIQTPISYNNLGKVSNLDSTLAGGSTLPAVYLRKHFTISDSLAFPNIVLESHLDDAAILYLNGDEIARYNTTDGATEIEELLNNREDTLFRSVLDKAVLDSADNVLAVKLVQGTDTEEDLFFDLNLTGSRYELGIIRGPYLQVSTDTSIIVKWRTLEASASKIKYGTSLASLNNTVEDLRVTTEHQVLLKGLQPATQYYYALYDELDHVIVGEDEQHYFLTHPTAGEANNYRFWVIGDAGRSTTEQKAVMTAYQNFNGTAPTAAWLLLGDNAYNEGTDTEYQRAMFENMFESEMVHTPIFPTPGNHDLRNYGTVNQGIVDAPYFDIFEVPTLGEAGGEPSHTESYYSFNYGNVHFISLDSYGTSLATVSEMATWLENDLADNQLKWVVAYWHHPPYSKGSHDSDDNTDSHGIMRLIRTNILPLLENGGVDLVLTGHSHSYERSFLANGHYGASSTLHDDDHIFEPQSQGLLHNDHYVKNPADVNYPNLGTVYAVVGCSGSATDSKADWERQPDNNLTNDFMFMSTKDHIGSFVLDVHADTLSGLFLNNVGEVVDEFAIVKDITKTMTYAAGVGTRITNGPHFNKVTSASSTTVHVHYTTNQPVITKFVYETGNSGAQTYTDLSLKTEHTFTITIEENATYNYKIYSNEHKALYQGETEQAFNYSLLPVQSHNRANEAFVVFPNPVDEKEALTLRVPNSGKLTVKITNEKGEQLATLLNNKTVSQGEVDLKLPKTVGAGIYVLDIQLNGQHTAKTIVIE